MVCGASQGIGEATARELAALGCEVILLARTKAKLEKIMAELPGTGHSLIAQDLSDREGLAGQVRAQLENGPIHILVNNTGGPKPGPIAEAQEETFLDGFANHVLVSTLLAQLLLPGMKETGYGRVINVISTSVRIPIPNLGVSNTIRGAMASWAKTLSMEVAPHGITVNNILPGFTKTPRLASLIENAAKREGMPVPEMEDVWRAKVPARRFAEASEVASAAAFLASPAAGYINGVSIPVDGGRTGCI